MYSKHFLSEAGAGFIEFMREYEARLSEAVQEKVVDIRSCAFQLEPSLLPSTITRPVVYVGDDYITVVDDVLTITIPDLVGLSTITIGETEIGSWLHSEQSISVDVSDITYNNCDITITSCTVGNSFVKDYMAAHFPEAYTQIHSRLWDTPLYTSDYEGYTRKDFYDCCRDFLFFSRHSERKRAIKAMLAITLGVPYSPLNGRVLHNNYETVTVISTGGNRTETVFIPVTFRPYLTVTDNDRVVFGQPLTSTIEVV